MRIEVMSLMMSALLISGSFGVTKAEPSLDIAQQQQAASGRQGEPHAEVKNDQQGASQFDGLRVEGFNAVYNLDYKTARERFLQMTRLAPDHPAGYLYLANNLWLETLYLTRRLTTSVYTGGSFYSEDANEDKVDPKRDREFQDLIKQAIAVSRPPPRAVPWIAATTGLEDFSIRSRMALKPGPRRPSPLEVIFPNSRMSAPAMNVRPPPISTIAFTASSFSNCSTPAAMPSGTPGLKAFTGGLFTVRIPTSPSLLVNTKSLIRSDFSSPQRGVRTKIERGAHCRCADWRLVFCLGGSGGRENVKEDSDDVAEEHAGATKRDHRLNGGEPDPVTEGQRGSQAQRAENKRYQ